jgi:predicted MFS family arabinose efflux permease
MPALPRLLHLFAAGNFIVGTGAFGITGILNVIADDLGVGVGAAGQAMTAYAAACALVAPLLLVATARWPRKRVMQSALALFAAGATMCALADGLWVLLLGRALMGAAAVFTPLAAGVTVAMVAPAQRGKALAGIFIGISLSYVIGVPAVAWMGLALGWRWPNLLIAAMALGMVFLLGKGLRRDLQAPTPTFQGLWPVVRRPAVVLPLSLTLLYFSALFAVSTYTGPVQLALNPLTPRELSFTLVAFGAAGVLGTVLSGWSIDRLGAVGTLRWQATGFLGVMTAAPLTQGHYAFTLAAFVGLSLCSFGMMAPQQARLAEAAPEHAPLLLSLNASMIYAGTALGSALGALALPWLGFSRLPWVAAAVMFMGVLTLWPFRLKRIAPSRLPPRPRSP